MTLRVSDSDLIVIVIVTWTVFAILAMFLLYFVQQVGGWLTRCYRSFARARAGEERTGSQAEIYFLQQAERARHLGWSADTKTKTLLYFL